MQVYIHDLFGFTAERIRDELAPVILKQDGLHFGFMGSAPLSEDLTATTKSIIEGLLIKPGNPHHLIDSTLPIKHNIPPPSALLDAMYLYGINPLLPQQYSDYVRIWGSAYIKEGVIYTYNSAEREYRARPAATEHHQGVR